MNTCPNPNSPEWKRLVDALGEGNAMTAYTLNNNETLDVYDAQRLLASLKAEEKDEQISKSSDEFKLERAKAQLTMLQRARFNAKPLQRVTLDKLMEMNMRQQEFLRENIQLVKNGMPPKKTVSVSNFIGASDFKGDPSKYEAFKLFGTFMHEALELAQVESLTSGVAIYDVMTQEFFDNALKNYKEKYPFNIDNLTEQAMFEMARGLAMHITVFNDKGFMILPEVTITGTTKTGSMVVGRLDLLLIDSQGRVNVFDFKTKKVKRLMETNPDGTRSINVDGALVHLAEKTFTVDNKPGTEAAFKGTNRSAYDTWTLQLKVYENMLIQNGLEVNDQSIVALMYEIDDDGKFEGAAIHVFDEKYYYDYAKGANVPNNNGYWKTEPTFGYQKLDSFRKTVDQQIPISEEAQAESKRKALISDLKITKEQNTALKTKIQGAITTELNDTLIQIEKLKREGNDTVLLAALETRRSTLRTYQDIVGKVTDDSELSFAYNFSNLLDTVERDVLRLSNLADNAMKNFKLSPDLAVSKEGQEILRIYQMSNSLGLVFDLLQDTITEARKNTENAFVVSELIDDRFIAIHGALNNIEAAFSYTALHNAVQVLKVPGEKIFTNVNTELKEVLELEIKKLEEQLKKLEEGKSASVLKAFKHNALMFMDSSYKKRVAEKLSQNGLEPGVLVQMENLQRQILQKKALLESGYMFNDEFLKKYIEGVRDPNAQNYAGRQGTFSGSGFFRNTYMDQFISSASNSELAISAFTIMLKNAEAKARLAIQNNFASMQFDQKRDALLQRYTVEELNDLMSEYRDHTFLNSNGELETVRRLYMSAPYTEAYKNTFKEYNLKLQIFRKEMSNLKAESHKKANTPEGPAAKQVYLDKVAEYEQYKDQYLQWMIDNAQLPYTEAFYSLQKALPQSIREELQKRYFEMETIVYDVGKGNEILLEEYDFERIQELEQEIRTLRQQAKEMSPEYAQYMDQLNDLYEYDVNINFYERMRDSAMVRYKDSHPELWEKWQKTNEVQRPTKRPELPKELTRGTNVMYQDQIWTVVTERAAGSVDLVNEDGETVVAMREDLQMLNWHEQLGLLYEAKAAIAGSDPEIQELMEERRAILRQYKVGGRLQPKFMSEDHVTRLDEIAGLIEEIMLEKRNTGVLDIQQKSQLVQISNEIKKISEKRLAQGYLDTFDEKLKILYAAQREMITAENDLATATTKADKKEIDAAQTALSKAEANFSKKEKEFRTWYNLHHNNKYQSVSTGYDVRQNALPKSYNFENLPVESLYSLYMETVPHPKYKIKRIKESAKNPDFLQSPEGIPMPKAVMQNNNGQYVIRPGFESSPNISDKYRKLMADPELFSFYNDTMTMYFDIQQKVEGRKMGYLVPGFAASTVENIARKGLVGSLYNEYQKFVENTWRTHSKIDQVDGIYGDLNGKLRHRFTEQLPEELQTRDAIGAIMKYTVEAQHNIAMQKVAPAVEQYIAYFELQLTELRKEVGTGKKFTTESGVQVNMEERVKELEEMLSILNFEKRKFLYGQSKSAAAGDRAINKKLNSALAYSSFIRIGFDLVNQTKNYISGNVQAFIAAGGLASDQYSRKDYMWAKSKVYGYGGFLHNYFADFGKIGDVSESTMLYRFFNPAQKDFLGYMNEVTGGRKRKVASHLTSIQELGFMFQDKGDTEIAVTVMYAVMNNNRYRVIAGKDALGNPIYQKDTNGEDVMIPVHEIYYKDSTGQLQRRQDVEYDQQDENRVRNIIYSEMRRTQGNYAKADQTKLEESPLGTLIMFFRKYLVPQLLNRFGFLRPNWEAGEAALGYWSAVGIVFRNYGPGYAMKHWIRGSKHMSKTNQNQLGQLLSRKMDQAGRDAIVMAILTMVSMMALMYVRKKNDEDEELSFLEGNAIRILWGVKGEATSMFPVGGGSQEYIKNFTTAVPLVREFMALQRLGSHAFYYGQAMLINGGQEPDPMYDSEYYQEIWKDAFYSRKSGVYEKGDPKIAKDFMDLTGLKNFRDLADPNYRIDIMKRNQ